MSSQFNRQVTIELGQLGRSGLRVQDLRVSFSVKKSSTDTFNTGKVAIYNLNENSRRFVDSFDITDDKNLLTISAGYEGNQKVLFRGNISLVSISIEKPNVITNIEANDGERTINELKFYPPLSYAAGTWAKHVLQDVINKTSLGQDYVNWSAIRDKQYKNGFSFQGDAKVLVNNLCNYLGLDWSIQDNQLKFNKSNDTDGAPVVNLTPDTGLISSPIRLNDIHSALYGQLSKADKEAEGLSKVTGATGRKYHKKISGGYEIKCLLQPTAEPGGVVQVTSDNIKKQQFRILEVEHSGDTHGAEWFSKLTTVAM